MPPEATGAEAHLRALEALYDSAPINRLFESRMELPKAGQSLIHFKVNGDAFHAANAAHGRFISRCWTTPPFTPPTGWSATASC